MKESLVIHESILQNPMAFLFFLQIRDMLRKRVFSPNVFTVERILGTFIAALRKQADFLVLQIIFRDFVKELDASVRDRFKKRIQEIDSLIVKKRAVNDLDLKTAKACLQCL